MSLKQKKELLIYTLKQEIFKEYVMCLIKIGDLKKYKKKEKSRPLTATECNKVIGSILDKTSIGKHLKMLNSYCR
jgi:hypothetical protein